MQDDKQKKKQKARTPRRKNSANNNQNNGGKTPKKTPQHKNNNKPKFHQGPRQWYDEYLSHQQLRKKLSNEEVFKGIFNIANNLKRDSKERHGFVEVKSPPLGRLRISNDRDRNRYEITCVSECCVHIHILDGIFLSSLCLCGCFNCSALWERMVRQWTVIVSISVVECFTLVLCLFSVESVMPDLVRV